MDRSSECIPDFISAMEAYGVRPTEPIAQALAGGELIRFACEGDRAGKRNGWAVLHTDGRPAGTFGNFRLGLSEKWKADAEAERLSPHERRARAKAWREQALRREADKAAMQRTSAAGCVERWDRGGRVDPAHPYLVAKGISGEGLRQSGDRLLVPMRDASGILWNLQAIGPDGTKRFAKGGRQSGLFCQIGTPDAVVCIAEGYATGAAVRRATGHAIAVAFSGDNLTATAIAIRDLFPDFDIVIAADDDPHLIDNPHIRKNKGLEDAHAAAQAVGGRVALPPRKAAAA